MDHKPSNPDTDSFVDDRMAILDPSPEWKPDAGLALEQLTQRKPAVNSQWMRLGMTATILAATVFVLVLLPWQRLWTPKPVPMVATQAQTAPAEKPPEKAQEAPTPQQPAEAAPQAPAAPSTPTAPQPQAGDQVLLDLPDNEQDLLRYLEELAKARGIEQSTRTSQFDRLQQFYDIQRATQASQTNESNPVVVRNVVPEYSDEARKERIKGTVILRVTVKVDGTVQFESFQKTLGYGLDEKAREAVEQWLFTPAKKDGVAVAKTTDVSVSFDLK